MHDDARYFPFGGTKIYIHLARIWNIDLYRERYLDGKEPDETPYGFHLARDEGFEVAFPGVESNRSIQFIARVVRRLAGFDIIHAWLNRDRIRQADAVWTMTEEEAFAIAFLVMIGVAPRRKIISNAIWLLNKWNKFNPVRRRLYRRLAEYLTVMTVHSESCLPVAREAFPTLQSQVMYFGINTTIFDLKKPVHHDDEPIRVFAIGNDKTRDWNTAFKAFGNDERFDVTLICRWVEDNIIQKYRNVQVIRDPSMADFLRCYQEADIVAIPMADNIFSGITVALEAASQGKAIVSSRTGGVPTYFDEDEVFYVPVGDAAAMRDAVLSTNAETRRQRAEAAQRRFIARDYSTRAMMGRYAEITRSVLANQNVSA